MSIQLSNFYTEIAAISLQEPSGTYIVLYSYAAQDENDLGVERGQCVTVSQIYSQARFVNKGGVKLKKGVAKVKNKNSLI